MATCTSSMIRTAPFDKSTDSHTSCVCNTNLQGLVVARRCFQPPLQPCTFDVPATIWQSHGENKNAHAFPSSPIPQTQSSCHFWVSQTPRTEFDTTASTYRLSSRAPSTTTFTSQTQLRQQPERSSLYRCDTENPSRKRPHKIDKSNDRIFGLPIQLDEHPHRLLRRQHHRLSLQPIVTSPS